MANGIKLKLTPRQLVSKYCVVTLFPLLMFYPIYADYTHTQRWKATKAAQAARAASLTNE